VVFAQDQTPVRVLVVDDSYPYRFILGAEVKATPGFELVGVASSGLEALDLLTSTDPQLVLLDLQMPELDGIETARRMHQQQPGVVVLLLTEPGGTPPDDVSLPIVDKGDLSSRRLADFWLRHNQNR
jgi:CheY-like chemotaxis protein